MMRSPALMYASSSVALRELEAWLEVDAGAAEVEVDVIVGIGVLREEFETVL